MNNQFFDTLKVVVKNKESTFYAKVSGESMKNAGLDDGDILVIDRSEELKNNKTDENKE